MCGIIEDGTGSGNKAKVTNNRLSTESVVSSKMSSVSSDSGQAFLIATDFISLTNTGSENAILYLKNNSNSNLRIQQVRACSDAENAAMKVRIVQNPTGGTIISDATPATVNSAKVGSNVNFDGLAYVGGDAKTVIGASNLTQYINKSVGHSIQGYDGGFILPNGNSIAILVNPSAATDFCIELQCFYQ